MTTDGPQTRRARHVLRGGLVLFCLLITLPAVAAEGPYQPRDDATVLERLPAASRVRNLAPLRAKLQAQPEQLKPALALARAYIELSRLEADPRYLGYAEATLEPWPDGPASVMVLRATVAQSRHEFEHALTLLDAVLAEDPGNAQARLTRATIRQVRGDLDAAAADCRRLIRRASTRVFMICHASARSLGGELESSYKQLGAALQQPGEPDVVVSVWGLTVLGEMARRLGHEEAAAHFESALALDDSDIYLQAAYADLLLAENNNTAVIKRLGNRERQDVLLLRLALAGKGTGDGRRWATMLADRFTAAARRGDTTHAREHARFVLDVQDDPAGALKLARANWDIQKEPADIRILLRSAQAAGQPEAAQPALDWIAQHDFEDHRLDTLIRELRAAQP